MLDKTRLRIAMQKSGRLSEDSQELLARCGIKINLQQQRLIAFAENMPIDILRVRDDDIPGLVMDGVVDLGIIGENVLEEELLSRRAQGEDPRYYPASLRFRQLSSLAGYAVRRSLRRPAVFARLTYRHLLSTPAQAISR